MPLTFPCFDSIFAAARASSVAVNLRVLFAAITLLIAAVGLAGTAQAHGRTAAGHDHVRAERAATEMSDVRDATCSLRIGAHALGHGLAWAATRSGGAQSTDATCPIGYDSCCS